MNIIIAGSRDIGISLREKNQVFLILDKVFLNLNLNEPPVIFDGGCSGVDACGKEYAKTKGWQVDTYKADWLNLGKAAGPLRNQQMVDKADMLVVIRTKNSRGSKDVLARAKNKGIRFIDVVI